MVLCCFSIVSWDNASKPFRLYSLVADGGSLKNLSLARIIG